MGRPDFNLIQRQQRAIADSVGETAMWTRYVSADAESQTSAAAGLAPSTYMLQSVITGLFSPATNSLAELYNVGGQFVVGDMAATLIDCRPAANDQVIWRGTNYRVVTDPLQQQIAGRSAFRFILRRGMPTG